MNEQIEERRTRPDRRRVPSLGRRASDIVARRVSAEMGRRRLTGRQLAFRAGVDERTVRWVLDGRDTRLHTLESIADALGVPLVALVSEPAA